MERFRHYMKKYGRLGTISKWVNASALEDLERWRRMEREESVGSDGTEETNPKPE